MINSIFEVSFAFYGFEGDDIFQSSNKDKAQIICHEFFHVYQVIALKVVSEYAALHRYRLGIMGFLSKIILEIKELLM